MDIYEAIKNFQKQLAYQPIVENANKLKKAQSFVVAGMGGSNLVADLLKIRKPDLNISAHRNYGLPAGEKSALSKTLIIASSYSGNTEETVSSFLDAVKNKLNVAAVSTGGKLLELAKKYKKPYIQLPNLGIQPRMAIGLNLKAILKLMRENQVSREAAMLADTLKPYQLERHGKALARKLKGSFPVIYASARNFGLAYNWKIKFNETGKIPAFCNTFPELNHNEMTGFDAQPKTLELSRGFYFFFLKDLSDSAKVNKRMNVTERLYRERGLPVEVLILNGKSAMEKIFNSLIMADWTAYYTAKEYGVEPEQVPMVEEFKKLIK